MYSVVIVFCRKCFTFMLLESNIVEEDDDSQSGASSQVAKKFKFNWERTIITLLKKQDDKQMSVKRLRKKVM